MFHRATGRILCPYIHSKLPIIDQPKQSCPYRVDVEHVGYPVEEIDH